MQVGSAKVCEDRFAVDDESIFSVVIIPFLLVQAKGGDFSLINLDANRITPCGC